jgi:peptidoglycan/LPS O-acetylase OafA/YrhL
MTMSAQVIGRRLALLDALRGCAAMAVVLYHIYGNLAESVQGWIPSILTNLIQLGFLGVPIFFVLSDCVISCSTD